jgi:D-cysteine desulfhydrase
LPAALDCIPRLGWVDAPTPVTELGEVAADLGLAFFGVKRDDLLEPLYGGAKPRKLDYLLATPPFTDASVFCGIGGIGSGAMVALTAAAERLGRRVDAHLFWTTLSEGVTENLAFTASGPTRVLFYPTRLALAVRNPALVGVAPARGRALVPPGATSGLGMVGIVRAGLELAEQIRTGVLPKPDRVYLPLGSGGVAAGLAVGLGLGGVDTAIAAIAVVERVLSLRTRITGLEREILSVLAHAGIEAKAQPVRVDIDHAHLGRGYAEPTKASLDACTHFAPKGLALEPVYTGKTMAALRDDARRLGLRNVLFWQTARRGPIPHASDFKDRLPPALRRALDDPSAMGRRIGRRRVLFTVGAVVTGSFASRVTGYPDTGPGRVLERWELAVVQAAAEALLPPAASVDEIAAVPTGVDRYVAGMPPEMQREVHAMLGLVEHGTPIGGRLHRFTRLPASAREEYLASLEAHGGVLSLAYRGLRDCCMLALYAQPSTWAALGYEGPRQPLSYDPHGAERWQWPAYDALVAPPGATPRGLVR